MKRIINIGNNCKIQKNVYIGNGIGISCGNNCQINDNVRLDNIIIGNDVMIGRDSIFLGKMHEYKLSDIPMINQGIIDSKPIIIEDDVWIGTRTVILPGVHINKGCIIGAGAVLTKNTEQFGVYVGVPAKLIRFRK